MRDFFVRLTLIQSLEHNVASAHSPATDPSYPDPTEPVQILSVRHRVDIGHGITYTRVHECAFYYQYSIQKLLKVEKRESKCRYTPLCIQFRPKTFAQLRKVLLYELQVKLVFLFIPQTPLLPKRILSNKVNRQ